MTDKQKEALKVLNELRYSSLALSDDNYYLLVDCVMGYTKDAPYPWSITTPPDEPLGPKYIKDGILKEEDRYTDFHWTSTNDGV